MMEYGNLPPILDVESIRQRLELIFPVGIINRNYVVRDLAARTVFVMLYIGAVEGSNRWIRPDQVTRMTNEQAQKSEQQERFSWIEQSMSSKRRAMPGRWYAPNTREPIRDETIRYGFIEYGAVVERTGLPTTSSKPRYALQSDFAELFNPYLSDELLVQAVEEWRAQNLSPSALARTRLVRSAIAESGNRLLVTFPNRETRHMLPGPSSVISKAIIEVFATTFLEAPGVIWLSESGNKVVQRDDDLARAIGLEIRSEKILPDIILVDLGPREPLLVFVEVVATDGPIDERRKSELLQIVTDAGFPERNAAFVTAYMDRGNSAFQKTFKSLAWNSFAWLQSEPDSLIVLNRADGSSGRYLHEFISSDQ